MVRRSLFVALIIIALFLMPASGLAMMMLPLGGRMLLSAEPDPGSNDPTPEPEPEPGLSTDQKLLNKEVLSRLPGTLKDEQFLPKFTDGLALSDSGGLSEEHDATLKGRIEAMGYLINLPEPEPEPEPEPTIEPNPTPDPMRGKMRDYAVEAYLAKHGHQLRDQSLLETFTRGLGDDDGLSADHTLTKEAMAQLDERMGKYDYLFVPKQPAGSHPRTPGHRGGDVSPYTEDQLKAFTAAGVKPGGFKKRALADKFMPHMKHMKALH